MDIDKTLEYFANFCDSQIQLNVTTQEELTKHKTYLKEMLNIVIELKKIIKDQETRICKLEKGEDVPITRVYPKKGGGQLH